MKRETHLGKVLGNVDPARAGGAKVQVNDLVGDAPLDSEEFFPGRFPFAGNGEGFYFAPQPGAALEVEAVSDDDEGVEDLAPRWVGMIYSSADQIPAEFLSDAPNRGGIRFGDDVLLMDKTLKIFALISSKVRLGEEAASHPVVRGDTYNTELSTFLDALTALAGGMKAAFTTLSGISVGVLGPLKPGFDAAITAWTAFEPAPAAFKATANTWLSTKVKTE